MDIIFFSSWKADPKPLQMSRRNFHLLCILDLVLPLEAVWCGDSKHQYEILLKKPPPCLPLSTGTAVPVLASVHINLSFGRHQLDCPERLSPQITGLFKLS